MIISSIQPCFVPWLGYFEQIAAADIFVYLDDVQYTKKDWRNTNRLKSPYGVKTIHVPVQKTSRETRLNEALISYRENWEETLINKITEWYKKARHFDEIVPLLEKALAGKYERLIDFNFHLNNDLLAYIGIATPIHFASDIPRTANDKENRIIEICKHFEGVDLLYDGKSAQNFINQEVFRARGIEVCFQDYRQTPYPQLWGGPFEPNLSILDLLMNCGKDAKKHILSSPLPEKLQNTIA